MSTIERSRVIRPSSRKPDSTYKVDVRKVTSTDTLHLVITHESDSSFLREYNIPGDKLADKDFIRFKWKGNDIVWQETIM